METGQMEESDTYDFEVGGTFSREQPPMTAAALIVQARTTV